MALSSGLAPPFSLPGLPEGPEFQVQLPRRGNWIGPPGSWECPVHSAVDTKLCCGDQGISPTHQLPQATQCYSYLSLMLCPWSLGPQENTPRKAKSHPRADRALVHLLPDLECGCHRGQCQPYRLQRVAQDQDEDGKRERQQPLGWTPGSGMHVLNARCSGAVPWAWAQAPRDK